MNEDDKLDDLAELQKRIGSLDAEMLLRYRVCKQQRDAVVELLLKKMNKIRCLATRLIEVFPETFVTGEARIILNITSETVAECEQLTSRWRNIRG